MPCQVVAPGLPTRYPERMSAFDVWVVRFEPGETSPAERLQQAFGIDASSASALAQSLPRIVKHAAPAKAAGEMRQALEAIGAVVECRPTRAKKRPADDSQAVFPAPDMNLVEPGRVSAIDPFSSSGDGSRPRISVDRTVPPLAAGSELAEGESEPPRRIGASLLATSRVNQRRRFIQQALGTVLAGVAIIAIGWFFGGSMLRGDAGWVGVAFDGLGIYFLGVGGFDLVQAWRG